MTNRTRLEDGTITTRPDEDLPLRRFRFHGLRKLNWAVRAWGGDYHGHMEAAGFGSWIEPGPILVVVGPNAGGKSTVIDLLRALSDAGLWPGLPRENYPGDNFSGFDIEGGRFSLSARFSKTTPETHQLFDWNTAILVAQSAEVHRAAQLLLPKYLCDGEWRQGIQDILNEIVGCPIHHLSATGRHPGDELDDATLVALLNELSPHFPSVFHNPQLAPFKLFQGAATEPGRIGVLFRDDTSQHAFVHRSVLPLGWLQIASVLGFMRRCGEGSLILLDEPDRHLHPSLQRVMLEVIAAERGRLGAQLVLATHSAVLCNPELAARVGAKTVVAARGRCEVLSDARRVLDDLGVTSGDLVQANGIIWVEGPSDRIYIKAWLELLASHLGRPAPIERVHYAFVSYGGALLKHLSLADETQDIVDLRAVNRNFFLVIDRDLPQDDKREIGAEKKRLLEEAEHLGHGPEIWITQHYTIESYLPPQWEACRRFVETLENGRTRVAGIGKVELATRFRNEMRNWTSSFRPDTDLPDRIAGLLALIDAWQTPQENIPVDFLPPYLESSMDENV